MYVSCKHHAQCTVCVYRTCCSICSCLRSLSFSSAVVNNGLSRHCIDISTNEVLTCKVTHVLDGITIHNMLHIQYLSYFCLPLKPLHLFILPAYPPSLSLPYPVIIQVSHNSWIWCRVTWLCLNRHSKMFHCLHVYTNAIHISIYVNDLLKTLRMSVASDFDSCAV